MMCDKLQSDWIMWTGNERLRVSFLVGSESSLIEYMFIHFFFYQYEFNKRLLGLDFLKVPL